MLRLLKKLRKNTKGAAGIEYGFLAALIAMAAIVSMQAVGVSLNTLFDGIASASDAASGDGGGNGGGNGNNGNGNGGGNGNGNNGNGNGNGGSNGGKP
ncbi:MAG: Flp family type IVb pilin [Alphaproteobacteria bacterium]|nr:MAG: Flp family type IVb pilin [Alphaproteobacteria bacterium]